MAILQGESCPTNKTHIAQDRSLRQHLQEFQGVGVDCLK
jgi:hypothetical protein